LDDPHVLEAPRGLERAVGRPVVDDDRRGARDAREAPLEPGHRVVGHDDDRDVHRRRFSHARITRPGSDSRTVTRKKRNPAANAWSPGTPSLPRKLTKNASRTAKPFSVNGTSST